MFLAYFDESGDAGVVNSPTQFFVLGCVLVRETDWLPYLDKLVALRRMLRQLYGVKTRPELKSTDIRRGRGPLLGLNWSPDRRMRLFRGLMIYQARELPNLRTFAIAIHKANCALKGRDPREAAWTSLSEHPGCFRRYSQHTDSAHFGRSQRSPIARLLLYANG